MVVLMGGTSSCSGGGLVAHLTLLGCLDPVIVTKFRGKDVAAFDRLLYRRHVVLKRSK